ncbi:MAG: TrpB-like pyridoxal phosphate-dependent enzyme, partial [Gemmatimonadales bacterium]
MRYTLPSDRIPTAWFNVAPHLSEPLAPPLHPATREPVGPDDLAPLFPMALIGQEVSTEPWIDVPGEVLDILRLWRPTPLVRARRLEE